MRTGAMHGGGVIFETPPYAFLALYAGVLLSVGKRFPFRQTFL